MIAFLNERSLEEHSDWMAGLQLFLLIAQEFSACKEAIFRDASYFLSGQFKGRFNSLAIPKDQRALVQALVFSDRYCPCWRPQRVSNAEVEYSCVDPVLALIDESICEAAERARATQPLSVIAVSTPDSVFGGGQRITVSSVSWNGEAVELRNAAALRVIKELIAQRRGHYERTSHSAPKDFQTVLEKDPSRFRRTGQVERRSSRRIFQEIQTHHFYYVDDGHWGHAAHLEVFSDDGVHLGVADIDEGVLDDAGRVEGRRLRL